MCSEKILFWNQSTQGYSQNTAITPDWALNGFTVVNDGTTIVFINGEPILSGVSKSFGGNRGEVYRGRIDLQFQIPIPAPGTITNSAYVTQKFYVKPGSKCEPLPTIDEYLSL